MGEFSRLGRALLSRGYMITPIRPGDKRPAVNDWTRVRFTASDVDDYPREGLGVLTGQGAVPIAAIDIDVRLPDLAEQFACWCREHLGVTCERVGAAPKVMLIYRAAAPDWAKTTSAWFGEAGATDVKQCHRVEILGRGQQFVAYATHPGTGRPYEWLDWMGGIEHCDAVELPILTHEQVLAAVAEFERLAQEHGLARVRGGSNGKRTRAAVATDDDDDVLMTYSPPLGLPLEDAVRLLAFIDNEDHDTWVAAGQALHHEYGGSLEALDAWDEYSRSASNYQGFDDLEKRWASFGKWKGRPLTIRWLLKFGKEGEKKQMLANAREQLEDAKSQIEQCTDQIVLTSVVAHAAGLAAGDHTGVRAELAGLIRARFKALTGTALSETDVRAAMAAGRVGAQAAGTAVALEEGARGRRRDSEMGLADRVVDRFGEGIMYVPETNRWYRWTGVYWRGCEQNEIELLVKEVVRALPAEHVRVTSDIEKGRFFEFCKAAQRWQTVTHVVSLLKSEARVVVPIEKIDASPHLLGVGNGIVDLRTGELLPPDPSARITICTRVPYDPDAKAPLFEQTVREAHRGDEEMVDYLQRLIGYTITREPVEDIMVIHHGGGGNGKSTVLGAIREALGPHAATAGPETFTGDGKANAGGAREDILRLRNRRMVVVAEPKEGAVLREDLVKATTGGDLIPARGIYARATVEIEPCWCVHMSTNHKPIVRGSDDGIWRRLVFVPWTLKFGKDPNTVKDPDRADKLRRELPGVLAWCVRAVLAYRARRLVQPPLVAAGNVDYRTKMDVLADWLDEYCEVEEGAFCTKQEAFASWSAYCRANGETRWMTTARELYRRLDERFRETRISRTGPRGYAGFRVKGIGDLL